MLQAVRVAWSALTAGVRTTAHGGTYPSVKKQRYVLYISKTKQKENGKERRKEKKKKQKSRKPHPCPCLIAVALLDLPFLLWKREWILTLGGEIAGTCPSSIDGGCHPLGT